MNPSSFVVAIACGVTLACGGCSTEGAARDDGGTQEDDAGARDLAAIGDAERGTGDAPVAVDLALADLSPRTVQGRLLDANEAGIAGFKVSIGSAQTTTDVAGGFALTVPGGSYDVLVAGIQGPNAALPGYTIVLEYRGLTRSDPTLRTETAVIADAPATRHATLSGTVTGVPLPLAAEDSGKVFLDDVGVVMSYGGGSGSLAYANAAVEWAGGVSKSTRLRALFVHPLASGSWTVTGYLDQAVTLVDGNDVLVDVGATAPAVATLTANVVPVPGASNTHVATYVRVGPGLSAATYSKGLSGGGALSLPQPVIAGADLSLDANSSFSGIAFRSAHVVYHGLAANAAVGSVDIPTPGTAVAPVGAPDAVARSADFSLQGAGTVGVLHTFRFATENGVWVVVTTDTTAKCPDGSALGVLPAPAGTSVLTEIGEYQNPTVDDAAGTKRFLDASVAVIPGSAYRTFTARTAGVRFVD